MRNVAGVISILCGVLIIVGHGVLNVLMDMHGPESALFDFVAAHHMVITLVSIISILTSVLTGCALIGREE